MKRVSVLGAGSWGIALATVLDANGCDVTVWSVLEDEIKMLDEKREHESKLPGVRLSDKIHFVSDQDAACADMDLIVLAVPSKFIRATARSMAEHIKADQLIVNVAKGIEEETLMPMVDVIEDELAAHFGEERRDAFRVAVLSGPSHAEEVGRALPTTVVCGSKRTGDAEYIQEIFMNDYFRVYTSCDVLGIELGGSIKNVMALAAGMADGLGFGDNTKAALITRGISEMTRLAVAMGASEKTLNGLSGIGDLIVTCASRHSRNRKAGVLIGQGMSVQDAMDEVAMVVEGVYSAKAAIALGKKYGVSMPISEEVNRVLFEGASAKDAVRRLMQRERKPED